MKKRFFVLLVLMCLVINVTPTYATVNGAESTETTEDVKATEQNTVNTETAEVTVPEKEEPLQDVQAQSDNVEKVKTEDKYDTVLAEFSTKYKESDKNRTINLKVASKALDGQVIEPGKTLSFNKTTGERTAKKGYKKAKIISGGRYVDGLAGGVCQISTTLFNTALLSNMEIVQRKSHSLKSTYVDVGMDATVSYGSIDFVIKNPYNYPVKVVSTVSDGVATVKILGPDKLKSVPELKVSKSGRTYTLKRTVNGKANYTTNSTYRN